MQLDVGLEGSLLVSEGDDEMWDGRVPSHYIGLTWMRMHRLSDVVLLDTRNGLVQWP